MKVRRGVSTSQVAVAVVIILVLVAAGAYFALTPSPAPPTKTVTTATTGIPPQTIVAQRNAPIRDLDPRSTSTIDIVQNVYETLTYLTPNGTVVPGLALSWTHNSDYTNWQYTLRQGVKFHDGTPFNSSAVVFSIKNIVKWGGGDAPTVWNTFKDAVSTGPYTLNITTTSPTNLPIVTGSAYAAFMFSPNILKYSKAANDTVALYNWFNVPHDDGSGPYSINSTASSFSAGQVILNAFPSYWGGFRPGQITSVIFKVVTNVDTAVQLALSGQLHVIGLGGQYQYVPQLLSAGLQVKAGQSFAAIWLLFNTQHQYLNNPLVRQALLTAIDYNQIVNQAFYGYANPFGGIVNPGKPFFDPKAPTYGPKPNITIAKQLLASAGYPGGLNATWTITYSTGSPFLGIASQLLQTFWKPLGVTLNIQGMGFVQLTKKAGYFDPASGIPFKPGPISYANSSQAQDILLLNWVGATADPWLVPDELFAIQPPPYQNSIVWNWSYWRNQTFTDLLNKARVDEAINSQLAQQEFQTLNRMFFQSAPGIGLFAQRQVWVVNPHFQGYVPNPFYGFNYLFYYQLTYQP